MDEQQQVQVDRSDEVADAGGPVRPGPGARRRRHVHRGVRGRHGRAAVAFAAALFRVVSSGSVRGALGDVVERALTVPF